MQQFNIEYVPIKCKDNVQADLLSRLPQVHANRVKRQRNMANETEIHGIDDELRRKIPSEIPDYEGDDVIACLCQRNKEYGIMVQCDSCDR